MASKRLLDNLIEETDLSKRIRLEHKLISVTINNNYPEVDIDHHHEIQKLLLIFNLLIEAETNKENLNQDVQDRIPDILLTIAEKLLQLLHNNTDS